MWNADKTRAEEKREGAGGAKHGSREALHPACSASRLVRHDHEADAAIRDGSGFDTRPAMHGRRWEG
jgi:hypothetical protein